MTNLYPGTSQGNRGLTAMDAPQPVPVAATTTSTALVGGPAKAPPPGLPRLVSGRNTPRLLAQLRVAVVVTSLLFAVLCLVGTALPYGALTGARADIEQGQRLRTAQADLAKAEAFAAEAADPKLPTDAAAFGKQSDQLTAQVVTAAAATPTDAAALGSIASQIGAFRAAVAVGLAQKTTSDSTKAQSAVSAATSAVEATAGTSLTTLTTAADNRLPTRFSTTVVPLVVAAAIVALLTALAAATLLALRTRRVINVGITGAVVALLIALSLAFAASAAVTGAADVTDGHGLASARAAVDAQTLAEQARTAQLSGSARGQSFAEIATKVRASLDVVGSTAASAAWSQAEAAQARADLPGTRTAIDKVAAALTPIAANSALSATNAVTYDRVLVYGISAALLAVVAAFLASWGLTQRLNEYR